MFKLNEVKMSRNGGGSSGGSGGGRNSSSGASTTTGSRTFTYLRAPTTVQAKMNGSETLADGSSLRTWYFGNGFNDDRTVPSPVIEANEGEVVEITLNSGMEHTIHLHGLDVDQQNDGVPSTSFAVGGPGNPNSYTYTFIAPHAGTYQYHCHVDTVKHYEMGMFGTIIIRPADGSINQVWANGPVFDKEYIWQLTTFDSSWHIGNTGGATTQRYSPDYFMINGKDGANLLNDSTSAITEPAGQKVLVRINGTSYLPGVIRMGGLTFEVIASDGRPLAQSYTTTEQQCAAGERYDILVTMPSSGQYNVGIEYHDIRNLKVIGSAMTTLTVV